MTITAQTSYQRASENLRRLQARGGPPPRRLRDQRPVRWFERADRSVPAGDEQTHIRFMLWGDDQEYVLPVGFIADHMG